MSKPSQRFPVCTIFCMISKKRNIAVQKTSSFKISNNNNNSIHWIEALLQNGIVDHRKYVVSIILIPYFVNIKCLSDTDAIVKPIKEWLIKCSKLRQLDITYINNFDYKIKYHIGICH